MRFSERRLQAAVGKQYFLWSAYAVGARTHRRGYMLCRCKCGYELGINIDRLESGASKGCGKCIKRIGKRSIVEYLDEKTMQHIEYLNSFVGKDFNGRIVRSFDGYDIKTKRAKFSLQCSKCGFERRVGLQLLREHGKKVFCKCNRRGKKIKYLCGDIAQTFYGTIQRSSLARGLEWSLTPEYLWEIYEAQGRKCALSGIPIVIQLRHDERLDNAASVDRIDSSMGYIVGNVQWVHKWINLMKLDHTQDEFISYCKSVADYSKQMPMPTFMRVN